mmetsp:Transcript_963/g.1717  ORF Transcript_963/g.1717 Transcript_963/m.1717 type:complete len:109 (+) Transcript_963:1244-1570(+)
MTEEHILIVNKLIRSKQFEPGNLQDKACSYVQDLCERLILSNLDIIDLKEIAQVSCIINQLALPPSHFPAVLDVNDYLRSCVLDALGHHYDHKGQLKRVEADALPHLV